MCEHRDQLELKLNLLSHDSETHSSEQGHDVIRT